MKRRNRTELMRGNYARGVTCPRCCALPGMPCTKVDGSHSPVTYMHGARRVKFVDSNLDGRPAPGWEG